MIASPARRAVAPPGTSSGWAARISRGWSSLLTGVLGLVLGGIGEMLVEFRESPQLRGLSPQLSLLFYLLGIGVFVASARAAWLTMRSAPAVAAEAGPQRVKLRWPILAGGV